MERAERYFRDGAVRDAATMEKRPTTWRSSSSRKGQTDAAVHSSRDSSKRHRSTRTRTSRWPRFISAPADPERESQVLERLLQRNPKHDAALELLSQWKGR